MSFSVPKHEGKLIPVMVCGENERIKLGALRSFIRKYKVTDAYVVGIQKEEDVNIDNCCVHAISVFSLFDGKKL